jgi:hypothetical protein
MAKTINQTICSVMRRVSAIGKTQKNTSQNFNFRGIDDVMNELHNIMSEEGLFVVPSLRGTPVVKEFAGSTAGKITFRVWAEYEFLFYCEEDTNFVKAVVLGEAMDNGDKGANKAISVALKYALLQTFMIPTQEMIDPDKEAHEVKKKESPLEALVKYIQSKGEKSVPFGHYISAQFGVAKVSKISEKDIASLDLDAEYKTFLQSEVK